MCIRYFFLPRRDNETNVFVLIPKFTSFSELGVCCTTYISNPTSIRARLKVKYPYLPGSSENCSMTRLAHSCL